MRDSRSLVEASTVANASYMRLAAALRIGSLTRLAAALRIDSLTRLAAALRIGWLRGRH